MLRKLLFLTCVTGFFYLIGAAVPSAMAQTATIKGTITDAQTGAPIPTANVFLEETQQGNVSNGSGQYTITSVDYGKYTLRVSFIGYTTKEVTVTVDQPVVNVDVALKGSVEQLNNIVVTAQGVEQTARSTTASVQTISGSGLAKAHTANFAASMIGKVAGLQIHRAPTLGGSANINMRGISSITGSNQPLYIIDGIPFVKQSFNGSGIVTRNGGGLAQGTGGYSYSSPLANLNPSNIKSVTVLKGAAATALYGSRGANGVIKIQTKTGAGRQGLGLTIKQAVSFSSVYGLPEYQHKYGGGPGYTSFTPGYTFNSSNTNAIANGSVHAVPSDQYFANYSDDESWGPRLDGRMVRQWYSFDHLSGAYQKETPWVAHPNNVKKFFDTGIDMSTNVGIASGGENYSYHISLRRKHVKGAVPLAKHRLKQVGFNGQADLSDKLHAQLIANYSVSNFSHLPATGYVDRNVFQQFNQFGQMQLAYGPDSPLANYTYADGSSRSWNYKNIAAAQNNHQGQPHIFHDSPYWVRHKNFANQNTKRIWGKVKFIYDLTNFLNVSAQAKTNYYTDHRQRQTAKTSVPQSGFQQTLRLVQETDAGVRLSYKQQVSQDISVHAFVAGQVLYRNLHNFYQSTVGGLIAPGIYNIQNSISRPQVTDYYRQRRHDVVLGQVRFGYKDLLYLRLAGRNEWASTLPADNNMYQYYAAAGSFIFSDVGWFKDIDILSFGKLRVSYAKAGNAAPPYSLSATFPIRQPFEGSPQLSVPNTLNNPNLKPEQTHELDIGLNLKFFNNRLGVNATYYHKKSTDLIISIGVSRASGYANQFINAGELDNAGVDATLHAVPIRGNDFSWDVTLNFATNKNTVVSLIPGINNYPLGAAVFTASVNAPVGMPYGEIRVPTFVKKNGKKVINPSTGYYKIGKQRYVGSYMPDWTGSVSTTFHYKGFSALIALNGQKGGKIFSVSNMFGMYAGMMQPTARGKVRMRGLIANGVLPNGQPNDIVADANGFFHHFFGLGQAFVYDASYIKLQQVRLAYSIPLQTFGETPIRGLTVALYGQNLMTIFKNAPNFDPSTVLTAGNYQGIEAGRMAPKRTYGFSVQIQF